MNRALRLLGAFAVMLLSIPAMGGEWVDTYWPVNAGNTWYFTSGVTVGIDNFESYEYQIWQETDYEGEYDYLYEVHHLSDGKVYFDCADAGWQRVCVSPDVLLFDDDLLKNGGSRTTRTTASQRGVNYPATFTVTVSKAAGPVTVPAGTFTDCRNVKVSETASPPGESSVSATVFTAVLAPRVGLIKKRVAINDALKWVELVSGRVGSVDVREFTREALPSVAIASPLAGQKFGKSPVIVRGTARDNVRVASVWRRLNDNAWEPAQTTNDWVNWTATATLAPGTNTFSAFAVDSLGITSVVQSVRFIYDQFLPLVGAYAGLFYDSNAVAHGSSGLFKATVRPGGLFSASLQNGSRKFPFTGRLESDGKSTNHVARSGANLLTAELSIDLLGSEQFTGWLTDGAWRARLMADHTVFHASTNPATAFTNKYTLLIPGSTNGSAEPEGTGFGSVTVNKAGMLSFAGQLADGTAASQSVPLSTPGDWAFYVSLSKVKGSILGWLRLAPSADNHIAGRLEWIRPAGRTLNSYTNGFAVQSLVEGSVYTRAVTNHVLGWDSGAVVFAGGNIGGPFSNTVALGPGNRVTNLGPHKLTFNVVPPSGLFNATVKPPGQERSYPFKGAVLQRQGHGGGCLLSSNLGSRVYFGPNP